jgi:hypothetical protein
LLPTLVIDRGRNAGRKDGAPGNLKPGWWIEHVELATKKTSTEGFPGFPEGFRVQRIGIVDAKAVAEFPASEIATYFRQHPETARALLNESYNKRFTPSSFILETGSGFAVGWYSTKERYQCVQEFSDLADAATDYLLFSLGKRRWTQGMTSASH